MSDAVTNYRVRSNDTEFLLTTEDLAGLELARLSGTTYHVIHQHRGAVVSVESADPGNKQLTVTLDGEAFNVLVSDELDLLLDQMGFGLAAGKVMKEIKAPMPGLVLEITVTEGQELLEGDRLLILEAMKMENSILSQSSAKVKKIAVIAGQAVEKGQVLVEFE